MKNNILKKVGAKPVQLLHWRSVFYCGLNKQLTTMGLSLRQDMLVIFGFLEKNSGGFPVNAHARIPSQVYSQDLDLDFFCLHI